MRLRATLLAGMAIAALAPGCGSSDDPGLTPDGPATLWSPWLGAYTAEGLPRAVLNGVKVRVGRGGHAGWVRVRVAPRGDHVRARVGSWVRLSGRPGTYRLPAPRIAYDYREVVIGLDQRDGGLAIVHHEPCDSAEGEAADPCQIMALRVHRPVLAPTVRPLRADAQEVFAGRQLRVAGIPALDLDGDLVPDRTEDRTDLRVDAKITAVTTTSVHLTVTVSNRGPRSADLPRLVLAPSVPVGLGAWQGCRHDPTTGRQQVYERDSQGAPGEDPRAIQCTLEPIPAGLDRTVRVALPRVGPVALRLSASAEGSDTRPRDNATTVRARARLRAAAVVMPARLPFRHLRLRVDAAQAGPVIVRLRRGDRTLWERRLVFAAPGTRLLPVARALPGRRMRAVAAVAGGPATVTVTYGS